jgi:hypothetical protein
MKYLQDEPAQPTFPIPQSENDLSSTDFKIVKFETPDSQMPIYELRCYTQTVADQLEINTFFTEPAQPPPGIQ